MFAHPHQLYWGLLTIPLVISAYWRRDAVRTELVGTFHIWSEVVAPFCFRSACLRWRREVSLCLQLVTLASIVLAAADPVGLPIKPWLIALAVLLVVAEWCLYQRRWTE